MLPLAMYGYQTWSLQLFRDEFKVRVFGNRVLRRIFGPKRDEVTGGWRKLHNEGLHYFYYPPSMITMIKSRRMTEGACDTCGRGLHTGFRCESQKQRDH
jgi:hypothetical protein